MFEERQDLFSKRFKGKFKGICVTRYSTQSYNKLHIMCGPPFDVGYSLSDCLALSSSSSVHYSSSHAGC